MTSFELALFRYIELNQVFLRRYVFKDFKLTPRDMFSRIAPRASPDMLATFNYDIGSLVFYLARTT